MIAARRCYLPQSLLLILLAASCLGDEGSSCIATYTVRAGDNLSNIATQCRISLSAVEAANPQIQNPSLIDIGEQICLPATCRMAGASPQGAVAAGPDQKAASPQTAAVETPQAGPPSQGITCLGGQGSPYTIKAGDSVDNLAAACGIAEAYLLQLNPQVQNAGNISAGAQLCLPSNCTLRQSDLAAAPAAAALPPGVGATGNISGTGVAAGSASCGGQFSRKYSIQAGDTLSAIASTCNVSLASLLTANQQFSSNPALIFPGNECCIPTTCSLGTTQASAPAGSGQYLGPSAATAPSCDVTHITQNGDRCWQLQQKWGLTAANFSALNPGVNCLSLQIGQPLCMGTTTVPPRVPCQLFYSVEANDTCDTISTRTSLGTGQIQALNPGLPCEDLASLRAAGDICIRNSIITPASTRILCTQYFAAAEGSSCGSILSEAANLTLADLESLNPLLNCSAPVGANVAGANISVCVAGRVLQPSEDYNNIANPARSALLGKIVDGLASVDPDLQPLFDNFTASASVAANDALMAELRYALNQSAAVQPAQQLEASIGRSTLEQAFFPQGINTYCNFLAAHLPNSKTSSCLCSLGPQTPLLICVPQVPYDVAAATQAALGAAANTLVTSFASSPSPQAAPPAATSAAFLASSQLTQPTLSANGRRLTQQPQGQCINSAGAPSSADDSSDSSGAALDSIAADDAVAYNVLTFLQKAGVCDFTGNIKLASSKSSKDGDAGLLKSQQLAKRFKESDLKKQLETVNAGVKDIQKWTESPPTSECCTPTACIPVLEDVVDICIKGGVCLPGFEVHEIGSNLLVCEALDVSNLTPEDIVTGVDSQTCYVATDGQSDIMDTLVKQKATLTVSMCLFKEIFSSISALIGGFSGCLPGYETDFYFLKGTIEIIPPPVQLGIVELDIDLTVKAWDAPSGLCTSPYYKCEDFCTMAKGQVYGSIKVQQSGLITGIENAGVSFVNTFAGFFAKHVDPPPPLVLKTWNFGSQGACASSPDVVSSHPLDIFAVYTTDWAQYRNITSDPAAGIVRPDWCKAYAYTPSHLDASLFTHIIYGFAKINANTYEVADTELDDKQLQAQLQGIKSGGVKTLISIGGWSFSTGTDVFSGKGTELIFPAMASTQANRATFIQSAISYAKERGFDGIDIDWEWPGAIGGIPCSTGSAGGCAQCTQSIADFTALLTELRAAMGSSMLLTTALRATATPAIHYQLANIHPAVDFINLMTYDYHGGSFGGSEGGVANVNSPVKDCHALIPNFDIAGALDAYLAAGVPANKIVMGLANYGRTFQLTGDGDAPGIATANGAPHAQEDTCTYSDGILAYYEIERFVQQSDIKTDPVSMAAYARYNGSSWVGFDTADTHRQKICYARYKQLAGLFFWDGELDDALQLTTAARGNFDTANCGDFKVPSCSM